MGANVITISINPVIFRLGHLMIRWYGLILVASIMLAVWMADREAQRRGLTERQFGGAAYWAVGGGLLGARLFHILDHWDHEYAAAPLRAFAIWEGGLAIWGGVIGGLVALAIFSWRRRVGPGLIADVAVPGLALASAVGRLACIITGDAVGHPTGGPLGFAYTNPMAMVPRLGVYYIPSPLYEIAMNLAIFAVLWRLRRRELPQGVLALIYLSLYPTGRFIVTFWSAYRTTAFGLNQARLISLATIVVALPLLIARLRQPNPRTLVTQGR